MAGPLPERASRRSADEGRELGVRALRAVKRGANQLRGQTPLDEPLGEKRHGCTPASCLLILEQQPQRYERAR